MAFHVFIKPLIVVTKGMPAGSQQKGGEKDDVP